MYEDISRKFLMDLISEIEKKIWENYSSYAKAKAFIELWQIWEYEVRNGWNDGYPNFDIFYQDEEKQKINLPETLSKMPKDLIVRIAIDLGIETPGFLPSIPKFKNVLKDENQTAYQNFERAVKNVEENPDESVTLASSTLESVIKTILEDMNLKTEKTLNKLMTQIIKAFDFDDKQKCPQEIITIAGSLRSLAKTIEDLRSDKSAAHGKSRDEYVVDDKLWADFIVNTCATLGLFLWEYFSRKYKPAKKEAGEVQTKGEITDLNDIPF